MKKVLSGFIILFLIVGLAYAQARGNSAEAKALLDKAVVFYKANGPEKAIAAFNVPRGQFVNKDLFIFAMDMNGKILAHADFHWLGKNMMSMKDPDGKAFMKEMIDTAKTKGKGSVDYKWANPRTISPEKKSSYFEKVDGVILGCAYYK